MFYGLSIGCIVSFLLASHGEWVSHCALQSCAPFSPVPLPFLMLSHPAALPHALPSRCPPSYSLSRKDRRGSAAQQLHGLLQRQLTHLVYGHVSNLSEVRSIEMYGWMSIFSEICIGHYYNPLTRKTFFFLLMIWR